MTDITQAEFWNVPNAAGLPSFSYAELLDQLTIDLPGGGGVSSVFTRTGAVVAAASDYDASQVDNDSGVAGAFVSDALDTLNTGLGTKLTEVSEDLTPELGGALDPKGFDIKTANQAGASASDSIKLETGSALNNASGDLTFETGAMADSTPARRSGAISFVTGDVNETGTFSGNIFFNIGSGGGSGTRGEFELGPDLGGFPVWFYRLNSTTDRVALQAPAASWSGDPAWTIPVDQNNPGDPLGIDLGEYTVANLPAASTYPNCWALATNASGGRTAVRSDGTNWKVIAVEGATVST